MTRPMVELHLLLFTMLVSLTVLYPPTGIASGDTVHGVRVVEDLEKFREEGEDRSNLYDDLETKDVVKRGISVGGDYEEIEENEEDPPSWSSSLDQDESSVDQDDSSEEETDSGRVREKAETRVKREQSERSGGEIEKTKMDENDRLTDRGERSSNDIVSGEQQLPQSNSDLVVVEMDTDAKQSGTGDSNDALKNVNTGENTETLFVLGQPKSELDAGSKMDENYQKHVEEEIQRKIDAIKEDIKREIEEKQRIKEIEENNARFDELRNQDQQQQREEDVADQEQSLEKSSAERAVKFAKRSSLKAAEHGGRTKKRVERKKRNEENSRKKEGSSLKGRKERSVRKRSSEGAENSLSPAKKREYAREVILVKNDQVKDKRRKRRRSRGAPAARDSLVSGLNVNDKAGLERSDVSSLKEGLEEPGFRLAAEYKEAFGGLQSEPGLALARFKRIKRVLRPFDSENKRAKRSTAITEDVA